MNQEKIISTKGLTKTYKKHQAVADLSVTINKGDIYGFIGRNGAGKTTFIRILTKLIEQSAGDLDFQNQEKIRIGAVIEGPACYPYLSAEDNLMCYALQQQIPDRKNRVQEVLKFIGLANTGKKSFKNFSLGMKQRLGIGMAILNKPDFLILDEPTNGLDPQGIVEIREMIQTLNQEDGTTILISSHILTELSMIATRYGIINEGRLIKELSKTELETECQQYVFLNSSNNQQMKKLFQQQGYDFQEVTEGICLSGVKRSEMQHLAQFLHQKDIYLIEATYQEENLEDYFLNLINGEKKHA